MATGDTPLVTLALFAYNQSKYIREAVAGAFNQTYSPLEIILSDDCSSDDTYLVMQELAECYVGPHRIVLNRNPRNLGMGGHVNHVVHLSTGELIVAAAGDDISLPERVQTLTDKWLETGKAAASIHSAVKLMDANGAELGTYRLHDRNLTSPMDLAEKCVLVGASQAWSKEVFITFGDLMDCVVFEDRTISFRSSLLGGIHYIDEALVKYRIGGVSNAEPFRDVEAVFAKRKIDLSRSDCNTRQHLADCDKIGVPASGPIVSSLKRTRERLSLEMQMTSGRHPIPLLAANLECFSAGLLKSSLKYCFPGLYWKMRHSTHKRHAQAATAMLDRMGTREI